GMEVYGLFNGKCRHGGEVSIGPSYHLYVGIPIGTEVLPKLDDASYKSLCGSGCEHRQGVCM
ncbi:hypothetical protein Tco_0074991, partial [Tanacetum coccineum]